MTAVVIVILFCLCSGQFLYIRRIKKQEQDWLNILRGIQGGERDKLFAKGNGQIADISYELNKIIDTNLIQIAQLKKADEANKQILTGLSHDVRTPLASLLGYLEALQKGSLDEVEKQEYLEVAFRKANDLKAYVDMLFEWFKLSSNEQQSVIETVDINEQTREIIIEWLPVLEQSSIALSVNIGDEDLPVSIDRMAYSRILNNLMQNAIQHSHCTQISIIIRQDVNRVLISVVNNGQIIPEDQLPHIFERLYKGDRARTGKGSGLGLAITKELVTNLHGEISVSSTQNEGTKFQISLPIQVRKK
ncbi:MAG: HAMP domain-containing sensor histidine kinase [Anaerocolumna aminovalerica]|uniref:sensor histidine kinase n=1 Tax=Anaerocolumna aminovalerica TaxID=1527 RepID=UPI002910834C|nr:HAMP domain-containing sensor histidine kinase [Anaerocolumna aminovalerica]MDU6265790.1 HAMP domain-containing sensor histidine kinase [Anaerocolumna aminovalerica]